MRVAVIGAGWAGCAAAVEAVRCGHAVTLFEAGRIAGGRARRIASASNAAAPRLDNGQHILIGAYSDTLRLMQELGIDLDAALLRMPLTLQFPGGMGLRLPANLPAPLDALAGIVGARGWSWADKASLLATAGRWQWQKFHCAPEATVADLCRGLRPGPMQQLIEPLCVSALNTPANRASGTVFLRVLKDSLFAAKGVKGGSNLLLPRVDLSALLPDAAIAWLNARGHTVKLGARVQSLERTDSHWRIAHSSSSETTLFDHTVLACPPLEAARLAALIAPLSAEENACMALWQQQAHNLRYEAITTVYMQTTPAVQLAQPMLALRATATAPAQFVFDRDALGGPPGMLAFVISASNPESNAVELGQQVLQQWVDSGLMPLKNAPQILQTITEKRATFACTPGLERPPMQIAQALSACGDYVDGPYPATLEGAVRSGLAVARKIG